MDQQTVLNKLITIQPSSPPWNYYQYLLQVLTKENSLVVKSMWDICKHSWSHNFNQSYDGKYSVDAFSSFNELSEQNKLESLIRKGITVNAGGMVMSAGTPAALIGNLHEEILVISRVFVGKSIYLQKRKKDKIKLPAGYDSIFIYDQGDEQVLKCDYLIYKSQQILPMYIVKIGFDRNKVREELCANCQKPANRYCIDQRSSFCLDCDTSHHNPKESSKLLSKHNRVNMKDKEKQLSECKIHPRKLTLFCTVCRESLCVLCKIDGHHYKGRQEGHKLVQIQQYYNTIKQQTIQAAKYFQPTKDRLKQKLKEIQLRIKAVKENEAQIEEQIYAAISKVIQQLKQVSERKIILLICEQLQIKRRFDRMSHLEIALNKQFEELDKNDFAVSYERFLLLRETYMNYQKFELDTNIKADIRLEGRLRVVHSQMVSFPVEEDQIRIPLTAGNRQPHKNIQTIDKTSKLIKTRLLQGPTYVVPDELLQKKYKEPKNFLTRTTIDRKIARPD